MNISLSWLKERVDLGDRTLDEVCDLLTFAGIEVEGLAVKGVDSDLIVVAEVKEAVQHPDADRLKVTQVDAGEGQLRQIVCGAKNYKVGDKVPCCLPGAKLPAGFEIGETKMRGVESKGMLAAASEIGLTDDEDGLMILKGDPTPGTKLKDLFPADTVIEVEVTPNRPDLLSHSGMARELATLLKSSWSPVEIASGEDATESDKVELKGGACPFYSRVDLTNVQVGASPDWLRKKLETLALVPVNNVVDITNYVLFELGQPLHAFDADLVAGGKIAVRESREGETFEALVGGELTLAQGDTVIVDGDDQILALGGVMGGAKSGVTEKTTSVILESAFFEPSAVRRTSRRLVLTSDSSYRFERGVDPQQVLPASSLATQLLVELTGATVQDGPIVAGTLPEAAAPVTLDRKRMHHLMDGSVDDAEADQILKQLGFSKSDDDCWSVPSWRHDVTRSADLVEEVARVVGLDRVPVRTGGEVVDESAADRLYDATLVLKQRLAALGFFEARTIKLISEAQLADCLPQRPLMDGDVIRVARPLSEDHAVMRPSLTAGLIQVADRNLRQNAHSLRFFETGEQFRNAGGGKAKDLEAKSVALLMSGNAQEESWQAASGGTKGRKIDLFDLKGALRSALAAPIQFAPRPRDGFVLAGDILIAGKVAGSYAQIRPARGRELGTKDPLYVAELDLAKVAALQKESFQVDPLPSFPGSASDIAMLLPVKTTNAEVEKAISKFTEPTLVSAEMFDLFADPSGEKLPADQKSLAYSFTYRSDTKTLKAKEVNAVHDRLKAHLKKQLKGVVFRGEE